MMGKSLCHSHPYALAAYVAILMASARVVAAQPSRSCEHVCQDETEFLALRDQVQYECEDRFLFEYKDGFSTLLQHMKFSEYCVQICKAEQKDKQLQTGSRHLCDFEVLDLARILEFESEAESAQSFIEYLRVLSGESYVSEMSKLLRHSPQMKQMTADALGAYLVRLASSPKSRAVICKMVLGSGDSRFEMGPTATCASSLGTILKRIGINVKASPQIVAAVIDGAWSIRAVVGNFNQGKINLAELEMLLIESVVGTGAGAIGAYAGARFGAHLADMIIPGSGFVAGVVVSYLGYQGGTWLARAVLDEFFNDGLTELDRVRKCRDLLHVGVDAGEGGIKAAFRKVSKQAHPDKGGSHEAQTKLEFCRAILLEHEDKNAVPFMNEVMVALFS